MYYSNLESINFIEALTSKCFALRTPFSIVKTFRVPDALK